MTIFTHAVSLHNILTTRIQHTVKVNELCSILLKHLGLQHGEEISVIVRNKFCNGRVFVVY